MIADMANKQKALKRWACFISSLISFFKNLLASHFKEIGKSGEKNTARAKGIGISRYHIQKGRPCFIRNGKLKQKAVREPNNRAVISKIIAVPLIFSEIPSALHK